MEWSSFLPSLQHLPKEALPRVQKAFELGKRLHAPQTRKSEEPYFTHPIAVATRLAERGADADTIIAALLHDTVEDTPITLPEIEEQFNGDVSMLIDGVTKLASSELVESPHLKEPIETLRKIFTLMQQDPRIMVIKLFDRQHNMETVRFISEEKQILLAEETRDVYAKIADRFSMQDMRYELEGMCLSVLEPELYQKLSDLRGQKKERKQRILEAMRETLAENQPEVASLVDIRAERQSWQKLRGQLAAEGKAVSGLPNFSIAFVCADRDACYRVLGALHTYWRREAMSFQDFINSPMINGYRGLHTTVIFEDGARVQCRIRTEEMEEYAHRGVTTLCFTPEGRQQLRKLLPWLQQLPTLTADTRSRSTDFWQGLQSDILGESIVIHGPGDQTTLLPSDATALDGAFYLFEDHALHLQALKVDGRTVLPSFPLKHAASLDASFNDELTVHRDWLHWVRTGYALGKIRQALSERSEEERIQTGKEMLQEVMLERRRGFLEEFNEKELEQAAKASGHPSLNNVYRDVADGHLSAPEAYETFFGPHRERASKGKKRTRRSSLIHYAVDMANVEMMDRINQIHRKYGDSLQEIRYQRGVRNMQDNVWVKGNFLPEEETSLRQELSLAGVDHLEVVAHSKRSFVLIAIVVLLWGLNPVIAKWFLMRGMEPLTLVTIRLLTFSVFAIVFFFSWRMLQPRHYSPVPRMMTLAALPALGLVGMSILNYFALDFLTPSLHLTILRLNTLLIPLLAVFFATPLKSRSSLSLLFLLLAPIGLLLYTPELPLRGILLSVLALLAYTFYSLSTEHVMQHKKISIRYPVYFLHVGILLGGAGVALLLLQPLTRFSILPTLLASIYIIFCVCIPHICHALLLKRMRFRYFTDASLLEVPIAIAFEIGLLGLILHPLHYLVIGFVLLSLFFRWREIAFHAP